jgi:acyl-CoA dehydrogenase
MYFALSAEQRDLQESVRAFALAHSSEADVRALMAERRTFDPDTWRLLAGEVGAVTLGSGAAPGGRGGSLVDAAAVLEVLGQFLFPGPYLSATVATVLLCRLDPADPARELLAAMAAGEAIVALVPSRSGSDVTAADPGPSAGLTGEAAAVVDGASATHLLVAAPLVGTPDAAWWVVDADAPGVQRTRLEGFDQTRELARVLFTDAPARRLASAVSDASLTADVATAEQICVAAELAGVARACLDTGLDYARARHQFGRPIGSFQALQHAFADLALQVECAWSSAYQAAWDFEYRPGEVARTAALAAATAGEASLAAAEHLMQVFGGVGFTWDNPAHLYLKRAKADRLRWGHPDVHYAALADLLGI